MASDLKIEIGKIPLEVKIAEKTAIEKSIRELMATLGIATSIDVWVNTDNPHFLTVNDRVCRYPSSLPGQIRANVERLFGPGEASVDPTYLEYLVKTILWLQPSVLLLDHEQVKLLLVDTASKEMQDECTRIFAEMLDLKISLAKQPVIRQVLEKYVNQQGMDWNDPREELIEALTSHEISIIISQNYFNEIISEKTGMNHFEKMRDELFYETGIKYPPIRFYFDDSLLHNNFVFKANSCVSLPVTGLRNDELLINDSIDWVTLLGIEGKAAINPVNGNSATLAPRYFKEKAEEARLTMWDTQGYFILCLGDFLRKNGYLFINNKFTEQYLEKFREAFPKITGLIQEGKLLSLTTKTLRLLAKEGISIRNLKTILEAILESDYVIADAQRYIIFDDRVAVHDLQANGWKQDAENVLGYVRAQMKRYLSHKYSGGKSTLVVHLLDPEIETAVYPEASLDSETQQRVFEAIFNEIGDLPSSQTPVILTTTNVRGRIKKLIEHALPQVTVLSYSELSPEINIQPVARISYNDVMNSAGDI